MSFMERQTYDYPMSGWEIETRFGTEYLPGDVHPVPAWLRKGITVRESDGPVFSELVSDLQQYAEGPIEAVTKVRGYFGRYSAPGYMDCTSWMFDHDLAELESELDRLYGDEDD